MKQIIFQVNHKKVIINMLGDSYESFSYMKDIKDLKKRVRHAINTNEENKHGQIMSWHFISSYLGNPGYRLIRLNEFEFVVERIGKGVEN